MKNKLNEQFLHFNYMQTLYQNLYNLKEFGRVEYMKAFYQLVARVDLNESEDQMVARYVSGLKFSIQEVLGLYTLWSFSEAYNKALVVEKQQNLSVSRSQQLCEVEIKV